MRAGAAVLRGLGRTLVSPRGVAWLWIANLVVALPAALLMAGRLRDSIGASRVHEGLREGFDMVWYGIWESSAEGIETTFTPSVLGAGPFLDNLEAWFRGDLFTADWALVALGVMFALAWLLLVGGVLEHYARPGGSAGLPALLGSGARLFPRFVRLGLLTALAYAGIFALARWLFPLVQHGLRDVTAERVALLWYLAAAAVVILALCLIHLASDYAKVAIVLEERRSALLALFAGLGFVLRHPLRTFAVLGTFAAAGLAVVALWGLAGPGAGQQTVIAVLLAFAAGQLYILVRIALRLSMLGAEMALYEDTHRHRVH